MTISDQVEEIQALLGRLHHCRECTLTILNPKGEMETGWDKVHEALGVPITTLLAFQDNLVKETI